MVSAEQTGNGDGTFRPATSITAGKGAKRSFLWGLNVPSPLPRNMVAPLSLKLVSPGERNTCQSTLTWIILHEVTYFQYWFHFR